MEIKEKGIAQTGVGISNTNKDKSFSKDVYRFVKWNGPSNTIYTALIYAFIFVSSIILRLIHLDLSDNGAPIFDEKHYVPQAEQISNLGMENNPAYGLVVHPPLGKHILSIGIDLFGYNPIGWRILSVVAGSIMVILIMAIAHKLTKSLTMGILAAILLTTEGVTFFMSRFGMLDIFLGLFTLAGVAFIVFRATNGEKLDSENIPIYKDFYLICAGILFGLAMSIKLSGVYFPAVAGICLFLLAVFTSKSFKRTIKITAIGIIHFAIIPLVVFLLSWIPWFRNDFSVYKEYAENNDTSNIIPEWIANILPDSMVSFYKYQAGVMEFHTGLTNSEGNIHPWESKPLDWLIGNGSLLAYSGNDHQMWLSTNRSIWILSFLVIVVSIIMVLFKDSMKWFIVLAGFCAAWVPWLFAYDRQMYLFYVVPLAPFLVLGIVLLIDGLVSYGAGKNIQSHSTEDNDEEYVMSKDSKLHKPAFILGAILLIAMILTVIEFILASPYIFYTILPENFINENNHFLKLPESFYIENWVEPKD